MKFKETEVCDFCREMRPCSEGESGGDREYGATICALCAAQAAALVLGQVRVAPRRPGALCSNPTHTSGCCK